MEIATYLAMSVLLKKCLVDFIGCDDLHLFCSLVVEIGIILILDTKKNYDLFWCLSQKALVGQK